MSSDPDFDGAPLRVDPTKLGRQHTGAIIAIRVKRKLPREPRARPFPIFAEVPLPPAFSERHLRIDEEAEKARAPHEKAFSRKCPRQMAANALGCPGLGVLLG